MTEKEERIAWENLANGIVLQAVSDYEKAYTAYLRDPFSKERQWKVEELRQFFRSEWYHQLTKVDGYFLRREIEKQCERRNGNHDEQ